MLSLAVKNTNLKAYDLAYGPAADAFRNMHDALSGLVAAHGDSPASDEVSRLAAGAEIAALRKRCFHLTSRRSATRRWTRWKRR